MHVKGLYLVQQSSSEIKLRIHTALGMTIYPNIPLSQTWSKITKGTPILIIALTGGRPVSGSDMRIRQEIGRSHDHQMGGSWASQLVRRCDSRGRGGHWGLSGTVVDNPLHTHTRAGMMWLGQKEVNHPSMGLGWHDQIGASLSTKGPKGSGVI